MKAVRVATGQPVPIEVKRVEILRPGGSAFSWTASFMGPDHWGRINVSQMLNVESGGLKIGEPVTLAALDEHGALQGAITFELRNWGGQHLLFVSDIGVAPHHVRGRFFNSDLAYAGIGSLLMVAAIQTLFRNFAASNINSEIALYLNPCTDEGARKFYAAIGMRVGSGGIACFSKIDAFCFMQKFRTKNNAMVA